MSSASAEELSAVVKILSLGSNMSALEERRSQPSSMTVAAIGLGAGQLLRYPGAGSDSRERKVLATCSFSPQPSMRSKHVEAH